jgi:alkanesulfonate monooxygenase SsuD/methylene tetrahydromethanopterin reductase-like flavin-dependent oxidoreductase (luciferase family)
MLPLGEDDAVGRPLGWPELRDLAVVADEAGLDSLWAPDHLVFHNGDRTEGIRECWTVLSAVAAITRRATIGPLVLATPFRNPAVTAKMAAELDEVSGGRLILGLGCGWHEPEFDDFDVPFDHRVGRFEEALSIILPLLRDGRVSFRGRWYRAETELRPPASRPGGPPILIAGKLPRMLRLVARHADLWNAAWYGPPAEAEELGARIERLGAACADVGRDPASLTLTAGVFVHFPELAREGDEEPPATAMRGTTAEVGALIAGYRARGIAEVIVHLWPRRAEAVRLLAEAAAVAREAQASATSV